LIIDAHKAEVGSQSANAIKMNLIRYRLSRLNSDQIDLIVDRFSPDRPLSTITPA
jgi:hypothetical protein